jgi:hypothetical protein
MARHWARLNRGIALLGRMTNRYPWYFVRYEDLCQDPIQIARRLLAAANTTIEQQDAAAVSHALGGSPAFLSSNSPILDERWRAEMPGDVQRRVMKVIGAAAYQFGYR